MGGQRPQHVEVAGREAGEAEQRHARGQRGQGGVLAQPRAGAGEPVGRPRLGDAVAQAPPQLGLPGGVRGQRAARAVAVVALRPGAHHRGPVQGVAVEQVGEVADRAEAARPAHGVRGLGGPAQVVGQRREPGLGKAAVDDLEQRPDGALGQPRVRVGRCRRRRRPRRPPARAAAGTRRSRTRRRRARGGAPSAADIRWRQPALHPARRDRDHLRRERVVQRGGQQGAQGVDEAVGPLGSVDVQHVTHMVAAGDDDLTHTPWVQRQSVSARSRISAPRSMSSGATVSGGAMRSTLPRPANLMTLTLRPSSRQRSVTPSP